MKKAQVRCWKTGLPDAPFITYPEGHMGHNLLCCTRCGTVHAAGVEQQLYVAPDLDRYLGAVDCAGCGRALGGHWDFYPDTYVDRNGRLQSFQRSLEIPSDANSTVIEFPDVFSLLEEQLNVSAIPKG